MAKESMKARERKRERLVARYAAKRKALKDAGDWDAIAEAAEELFSGAPAQPLPAHGTSHVGICVSSA